ncbi:dihydroneopterin aldolase [Candidatus Woesearchaeota archaeon]|nr:dihydroneopterin aldolase [Candidatus Woesearchaeota archaeon]
MIGKITLKGLKYQIKIGVTEEERKQPQPVLIDLQLYLDITKAVATEDIEETVNYSAVQKKVNVFLENKEYVLVEKVSADLVNLLLSEFEKIKAVKCTCWKPEALKDAENVGVTVVRKRK